MESTLILGGASILVLNEVVVRVFKYYLLDNNRLIPLISLISGTLLGWGAAVYMSSDIVTGLVLGFLCGAANVGFYEFGRTTIQGN